MHTIRKLSPVKNGFYDYQTFIVIIALIVSIFSSHLARRIHLHMLQSNSLTHMQEATAARKTKYKPIHTSTAINEYDL
jgi:hypothetical protein